MRLKLWKLTIFICCPLFITVDKRCLEMDWQIALSRQGWVNCSCLGSYLTGLWKENYLPIEIENVKSGQCCFPPHEYEDDTPDCQIVDWRKELRKLVKFVMSFD